VREGTEQNRREREKKNLYLLSKNPPLSLSPPPKKQILFLIPFLVFLLLVWYFLGGFCFPDRVWQSSLRLEGERERERVRRWGVVGSIWCCFHGSFQGFVWRIWDRIWSQVPQWKLMIVEGSRWKVRKYLVKHRRCRRGKEERKGKQ